MYFEKINLADLVIKENVVDIWSDCNSRNTLLNQVCMSFRNRRILKFKKRNGFKIYGSDGQSGEEEALVVHAILPNIQDTINKDATNLYGMLMSLVRFTKSHLQPHFSCKASWERSPERSRDMSCLYNC